MSDSVIDLTDTTPMVTTEAQWDALAAAVDAPELADAILDRMYPETISLEGLEYWVDAKPTITDTSVGMDGAKVWHLTHHRYTGGQQVAVGETWHNKDGKLHRVDGPAWVTHDTRTKSNSWGSFEHRIEGRKISWTTYYRKDRGAWWEVEVYSGTPTTKAKRACAPYNEKKDQTAGNYEDLF